MKTRKQELETLLEKECPKYEKDCTSCPYDKECNELERLINLNSICRTCKKLGGECTGTANKVYTGCVYREV